MVWLDTLDSGPMTARLHPEQPDLTLDILDTGHPGHWTAWTLDSLDTGQTIFPLEFLDTG